MVDEYQDTNYVQERIMLMLAKPQNNICVIGDDDQALDRFRGATVRNILEFKKHFEKDACSRVKLDINYRSHKDIIALYNDFMDNLVWKDNGNLKYRFLKQIKHDEEAAGTQSRYPSAVDILDPENAPKKVADLILYLKENKIIKDLNQIAFFMRSIASDNIKPFVEEFERKGIDYYAPRAKKYFENQEILEMIGCFVQIFRYTGAESEYKDAYQRILDYCQKADEFLKGQYEKEKDYKNLSQFLNTTYETIENLEADDALEDGPIDLFYKILASHPFSSYLDDEVKARNLSIFSHLLVLFQQYCHYEVITAKNKARMARDLFSSYLRFLYQAGVGEYEDPYDIFPSGKVQIMTIHRAKGLEFPVVIVAGLEKRNPPKENIDQILDPYYHREEFEPYERITDFDQMRLHYVAFSRAQDFLVLVSRKKPFKYYQKIFEKVKDVVDHFDNVVQKIRNKEFDVSNKPAKKVCDECDFRHCCRVDFASPIMRQVRSSFNCKNFLAEVEDIRKKRFLLFKANEEVLVHFPWSSFLYRKLFP
jgi:DNA helicase-2/ATP-dependent DNA helicase PcrA